MKNNFAYVDLISYFCTVMKNKTFSKLKKGDTLWVFDNSEDEPLRELTIKKVVREKPATLPANGGKWIVDTNAEPFRIRIDVEGDWIFIMKENFEESVVISYSDWNYFEFGILGTSKEAIKEKLCEMRDARKRGIDYSFNDILYEFEK